MVNTMTNEFAVKVAEEIEKATGWKCEVKEFRKNNVNLTGIIIRKDESNTAPTVYIPDSIADLTWEDLSEFDVIDAANEYIKAVENSPVLPEDTADKLSMIMTDKLEILRRVYFCLTNRNWNPSGEYVSRPVDGDLQYIYIIDVSDISEDGAIQLENEHIRRVGLTEDEIYSAAYANTQKKSPGVIIDLCDVVKRMPIPSGFMYVVSNEKGAYGAVAITYPDIQKKIAQKLGDDYVIIPVSVHECIVLRTPEEIDNDCLNAMVREINATVIQPQDRLSDHIYKVENGRLVSIN